MPLLTCGTLLLISFPCFFLFYFSYFYLYLVFLHHRKQRKKQSELSYIYSTQYIYIYTHIFSSSYCVGVLIWNLCKIWFPVDYLQIKGQYLFFPLICFSLHLSRQKFRYYFSFLINWKKVKNIYYVFWEDVSAAAYKVNLVYPKMFSL